MVWVLPALGLVQRRGHEACVLPKRRKPHVAVSVWCIFQLLTVKKIQSNGGIFVAEHNEANVRQRGDEKDPSLVYGSFSAGTLRKVCGRYVTVSPAGELRDPGFRG